MPRQESDPPRPIKPPKKTQGWRSAEQLNEDLVGGRKLISERLEIVRCELIGDIQTALSCSEDEAAALVEAHLIGERSPRRGAPALAANHGVERHLGLKSRKDAAAPKPAGWLSARELEKRYRGGATAIGKRIRELRLLLITDVKDALECTEAEAEALIDNHLIGRRKSRGSEGFAASPDAVRIAEDGGKLSRRIAQRTPRDKPEYER